MVCNLTDFSDNIVQCCFFVYSRLTEMLTNNWELSRQLRVPASGKTQVREVLTLMLMINASIKVYVCSKSISLFPLEATQHGCCP